MLYECNMFRLLTLKYSPLIVVLVVIVFIRELINSSRADSWPEMLPVTILLVLVGSLMFVLYFKIKDKLRYVAIGKSRLIINRNGKEIEYTWLDVESIELNRFFRLYKLKIKNEDVVYFTPYGLTTWLTGDESDMGVIINKMKNELQI